MSAPLAVVLGSAFRSPLLGGRRLLPRVVGTPWGAVRLHVPEGLPAARVLFRHGLPHAHLPHQVPWRAHAAALAAEGCRAVLLTSSVGVLDPDLPLDRPMLVSDLLMPANRLPDGSACTMWPEPEEGQGHLVVEGGLLDEELGRQVEGAGDAPLPRVVFAYEPGPRTKTPAENAFWRAAGAQVNSMSLGPEIVLLNELGIPVAALVAGHKRSGEAPGRLDAAAIDASLARARRAVEALAAAFLERGRPVPFKNRLHRL